MTFDSGGLSLKTPEGMLTMKCDMAGAATMLAAMQAIARLKLPANVVGLAGLVENMTGPGAYKLGDILHARSGKTIEVHNTDAEGRLVLADVLNVAVETGAAKIIDMATLTGACMVALGHDVAGVMTNDQSWCDTVIAAARRCGEPCWQLPMFREYDEQITSEVADIKNVGDGRYGGAITAAKLLEQFVEKRPWVHLDIAGPAFADKARPWTDGGASGCFVRTLVEVKLSVGSIAIVWVRTHEELRLAHGHHSRHYIGRPTPSRWRYRPLRADSRRIIDDFSVRRRAWSRSGGNHRDLAPICQTASSRCRDGGRDRVPNRAQPGHGSRSGCRFCRKAPPAAETPKKFL